MNSSKSCAPIPNNSLSRIKHDRQTEERIQVREFQYPEDYPAAHRLWENAGSGIHIRRSDEPEEIQKKLQRDPDLFLVAETNGRIIGTVIGGFDGRRGLIYHLAVDADFRQRGIGSRLMDEVEHRLKAKGCLKCYLLVTTDNENAMRFYEAREWERMNAIYMYSKEL
ncbi:MAG: GNAT family acetyltransferase [Anaerolineales bacterium]